MLLKFFPHLPDGRLWQAMAEVVGHIDALVECGDVVEEQRAGNTAYCVSRRYNVGSRRGNDSISPTTS